jgi:hypothetical protein
MGVFPHPLTDEERARGGQRYAERCERRRQEAHDLLVRELAAKMDKVVVVIGEAMDAEMPYGETSAPDHRTRLAGADRVMDRVLGKPGQTVEHTGAEGGPITVEHKARLTVADLANYLQPGDGSGRGAGGQLPAARPVLPDPGEDQPPAG